MKIAVNTRFLIKDKLEGIGRVSYEITKRLVEQHPNDEFVFFFDRPYDRSFIFGDNVQPVVLSPPARHPFLWYYWFEYSVATTLKRFAPDVFFSPDNYLSIRSHTKTVMVTHDLAHLYYAKEIPYLVRRYYEHFVPKFLNRADHIISVSAFTKQDIIKQYQINEQKITVAHNACSEEFAPVSETEKAAQKIKYTQGEDYFFYIGSIHPRKNIERLILAFDQFKSKTGSSIKLLLGGRFAWQTGSIKKTLDQAKYRSDIIMIGFIDKKELPKILGAASALVYVSLFEGFGLPILEAMQAGVPVITSNRSSMPEVAGEAALLVDPESTDEIANAMEGVLEKKVAKRLITAGKQQREKFSWNKSAEIVYETLVNVSGSPSKPKL